VHPLHQTAAIRLVRVGRVGVFGEVLVARRINGASLHTVIERFELLGVAPATTLPPCGSFGPPAVLPYYEGVLSRRFAVGINIVLQRGHYSQPGYGGRVTVYWTG